MLKVLSKLQKGNARLILIALVVIAVLVAVVFATGLVKLNVTVDRVDKSESTSVPSSKNPTISYESSKYGFTLKYPESWSVEAGTGSDPVVTFLSQKETANDKFRENLFVTVTDLSSKQDLNTSDVMDMWIKENKAGSYAATFDILSQKPVTVNDISAQQLTYTFTASGYEIKGMMTIAVKNNKAYLLSYSAEAKSFDTFTKEVNALISSFVIS